ASGIPSGFFSGSARKTPGGQSAGRLTESHARGRDSGRPQGFSHGRISRERVLLRAWLVELQVQQRDDERARAEEPEQSEVRPAEAEVRALAVGVGAHAIRGSRAAATKSSARYASE